MDKYKILIVDDDPNVRRVLDDTLRIKGYQTITAEDAAAAFVVLNQAPVNLVLTDLRLPDISGLEVLRRVKTVYPLTEVIILTGNATLDSVIESTNKGAFSYLQKPYDMDQLLLNIKRAIEKQQAEEMILKHSIELKKINSELKALYEVSLIISRTFDMKKLSAEVIASIASMEIFSFVKKALIFALDNKRLRLAPIGLSQTELKGCTKNPEDCLCGLAARNGEIVTSKDCRKDKCRKGKSHLTTPHGHVIVPLKSVNRVEGVLCLSTHPGTEPDEQILNLLSTLGNQIGIAIENLKLYEEAKSFSLHDPLTGLANRRLMEIQMEKSFETVKRYEKPLSIIMLDIDHFKKYNDSYGHVEGDRLLVAIANILLRQLRSPDHVFRYGGEEFLVMLPETDVKNAYKVAERLRKAVAAHSKVTISLGVSSYHTSIQGKEALISAADDALYLAKQNGRDRVEVDR
jgi:diguanylate cyclase (GGDEF)-like protein